MSTPSSRSPLQQALISTAVAAAFGVVVRYGWGAFDPEMRTWAVVGIAPWAGLYTYLRATGRDRAIANILIALGVFGILFWIAVLVSGRLRVTRADVPYAVLVLAFPVAAVAFGLVQRRRH